MRRKTPPWIRWRRGCGRPFPTGWLRFAVEMRLGQAESALALKEALIAKSDPRSILRLGYVLVTGEDGKVLKTVARVRAGDRIGVRFADGALTATVDDVKQAARPGRA